MYLSIQTRIRDGVWAEPVEEAALSNNRMSYLNDVINIGRNDMGDIIKPLRQRIRE